MAVSIATLVASIYCLRRLGRERDTSLEPFRGQIRECQEPIFVLCRAAYDNILRPEMAMMWVVLVSLKVLRVSDLMPL